MRAWRALLVAASLGAAGVTASCRSVPQGREDPHPARRDLDPALAHLAWLAGSWAGEAEGARMEEHWALPAGGLMLGMHRDVSPRGTFFEYLRIERRADGIHYVAQPRGGAPTAFRLVESRPRRAVFENPAHDHPRRILYWLDGAGLHARVEGREGASEWLWPASTLR